MRADANPNMQKAIPRREQGTALIVSLFAMVLVSGIVVTGAMVLRSHRQKTQTNYRLNAQSAQFARSGLAESLSWFRRQTSQPVVDFRPAIDDTTDPPIRDTMDEDIGLVREFKIEGNIWGRYEVWRVWDDDPVLSRREWRSRMQVSDISEMRGLGNDGNGWRLRTIGYVFERNHESARFDERPNHIVASQMLEGEILRMKLSPPGQSAVSVYRGANCTVNTFGRIVGGGEGAGVYYPVGTGTPTTGPPGDNRVTGTPPLASTTSFDGSILAIFGVRAEDLEGLADDVITDPASFPNPVRDYSFLAVDVPLITFDATRPLRGMGLVVVRGNVVILPGSNSSFSGMLYVDGNLTVRAPAELAGTVIVTGNLTLQGASDFATIRYDGNVLNLLRREIGNYRWKGALRPMNLRR